MVYFKPYGHEPQDLYVYVHDLDEFDPKPSHFDIGTFKINDTIYHEWNKEFEQALMWEIIQK